MNGRDELLNFNTSTTKKEKTEKERKKASALSIPVSLYETTNTLNNI